MADDEVEVFVVLSDTHGVATGDGALVEGVPDADAVHQRTAADARQWGQLVDHTGVGDEGAAVGNGDGNLVGNQTAEVAGVVVHDTAAQRVVDHAVVDFIYAAGNGLDQSASADDGIEGERDVCALQLLQNQVAPEVLLLGDVVEGREVFGGVGDAVEEDGLFVVVDGHLGGGGTGIDDKDTHRAVGMFSG